MDDELTHCSSTPHGLLFPAHPHQGHHSCLLLLLEWDMQSWRLCWAHIRGHDNVQWCMPLRDRVSRYHLFFHFPRPLENGQISPIITIVLTFLIHLGCCQNQGPWWDWMKRQWWLISGDQMLGGYFQTPPYRLLHCMINISPLVCHLLQVPQALIHNLPCIHALAVESLLPPTKNFTPMNPNVKCLLK